jgi:mannose-6-phosphate isomerase-like protein (cupin superfamily)
MSIVHVARFAELKGNKAGFLDTALAGGAKENLKLIGCGSSENAFPPAITGDHRYVMNWVKIPPGGGSRMHSHPTQEVFIPIEGAMTIYWIGPDGEHLSMTANPKDCVSVDGGAMRGFRNDGQNEALMLTIVTGHDAGGPLVWHSDVVAEQKSEGAIS